MRKEVILLIAIAGGFWSRSMLLELSGDESNRTGFVYPHLDGMPYVHYGQARLR